MGYSNWSDAAFESVRRTRSTAPAREIFRGKNSVDPLMDPRRLTVREARDSEHHPHSVPIIVAFDVTASMGHIPTEFAKESLGTLMNKLVQRGWVTDPQILFAAIGDAVSDRGPLQVGQFESGLEMDGWLTRIWIEGQGGDVPESYTLAHWFAAHRTATDAWEKRKKKGYLFTIGDAPNKSLKPSHLSRVFGGSPSEPCSDREVVAAATERWDTWHILVRRGTQAEAEAEANWRDLLGDRVLGLRHTPAICDLIGVVMGVREGNLDADRAQPLLSESGMEPAHVDAALRVLF